MRKTHKKSRASNKRRVTKPRGRKIQSKRPSRKETRVSAQPRLPSRVPQIEPQAPPVNVEWAARPALSRELPDRYGEHQIYLMIRDPYWLFTYWEIPEKVRQNALDSLGGDEKLTKPVLRVYDVTDNRKGVSFDVIINGMASDWYIEVKPNRSYAVEVGLLHENGRFVALARSNEVTTPRDGMSEVLDEKWMSKDFDKIYALSGGFEVGKSSLELRRLMEDRLQGAQTSGSGGFSSERPVPLKKPGYSFNIDCELVVYGAASPGSVVTIRGKKIGLKPDGTFSLRYALPDGKVVIDAHARSMDGTEERVVIPIVERKTRRPQPVVTPTQRN